MSVERATGKNPFAVSGLSVTYFLKATTLKAVALFEHLVQHEGQPHPGLFKLNLGDVTRGARIGDR